MSSADTIARHKLVTSQLEKVARVARRHRQVIEDSRRLVVQAVAEARTHRIHLNDLAHCAGVSPSTIKRWLKEARSEPIQPELPNGDPR